MFYNIVLKIVRVFLFFVFRLKMLGRENMPKDGGFILAVNHHSNWDPVLAGVASPRKLTFMAKEELFKNPVFGALIRKLGAFPVKRGSGDVGAFRAAIKILGSGGVMLIFPEGRRVKKGARGKAGAGVAAIAQRSKMPVVPMNISGSYKWMSKMTVTIGKPMSFDEYYGRKLTSEEQREIAEKIMDRVYEL
jgi:1-acyl-sn-glycerol-3-phosphate acyltransferase